MKSQIQNLNGGAPLSRALAGGLDSIVSSKGPSSKSAPKYTGFAIGDKAKLASTAAGKGSLISSKPSKSRLDDNQIQVDAKQKRDDLLHYMSRAKSFK